LAIVLPASAHFATGGLENLLPLALSLHKDDIPMLADALLALGMLMTTASQLRLGSSPLGPGEACLVLWLVIMLVREAARLGPPLTGALSRLLTFWTIFAMSLCLGFLTGLLPICVGRMTMSDTFTLALVASVPVFASLKIWLWLRSWKGNLCVLPSPAPWCLVCRCC
jgi:hypothetical protein